MALPALATIADLEARLGVTFADPSVERTQAHARLEDASAIVRAYAGHQWVNDEGALQDVPPAIPGLVASMVERATLNPGGITQEAAGPFSRSFGSDAAQRLYLTRVDKLVIRDAIGNRGIDVLTVTRGPLETPAVREDDLLSETDPDVVPWLL